MRVRVAVDTSAAPPFRALCRCGHLPTHHMQVVPTRESGGYRLEPSGPCGLCGEGVCRKFSPGGP
jgi:hypothetical protein